MTYLLLTDTVFAIADPLHVIYSSYAIGLPIYLFIYFFYNRPTKCSLIKNVNF